MHPCEDDRQLSLLELRDEWDLNLISEARQGEELAPAVQELLAVRLRDTGNILADLDLVLLLDYFWRGHADVVLLVGEADVIAEAIVDHQLVIISIVIDGIDHIVKGEVVATKVHGAFWYLRLLVEDVSTKINEPGLSVQVRIVLYFESVVYWIEILVRSFHLNFVCLPIGHLGQETELVLATASERLQSWLAVLESAAWQTPEGQDEIASTSIHSLALIIDRHNIAIIVEVKEPVLVHVCQLAPNTLLLLYLGDVDGHFASPLVRVLLTNGIHDFGIDCDFCVEEARRHNDDI